MRLGEVEAGSKTALVTGASKGIGRCYALQFFVAFAIGYFCTIKLHSCVAVGVDEGIFLFGDGE